ncbi:hypothetical protein RJT34_26623 [Clitoria ternatea]|uniref:START domain-containing protein n=1 Tax=Clitoria ternatea TaxID=43366 RepID=A0AAN9FBI6_CLITE
MVRRVARFSDGGRKNGMVFFIFTIYSASNQRDQLKLGACSSEEAARWIQVLQEVAVKHWGKSNHPVMMVVGVVDGTSEAIFHTLMSLASSRSEWDFCTYQAGVVDHVDSHTDIIHMKLYNDWLPWGMKPRDFLLRRYWRRKDDGTYVLLFHSVYHKKCPPQRGYVRASLKCGGFLVTPDNKGKRSLVKHMLAIDWKFWKLYLRPSYARSLTIRMLERVAALRELFKAKLGNYSSQPIEMARDIELSHSGKENAKIEVTEVESKVMELALEDEDIKESLMGLNESDEFFDVPEPMDCDQFENEGHALLSEQHSQSMESKLLDVQSAYHPKIPSAAGLVKKLHDLAVPGKECMDNEIAMDSLVPCPSPYGATLPQDSSCNLPNTWAESNPSLFFIRGGTYLCDRQKVKAEGTMMQMVGADWLQSDTREDNICGRLGSIVQDYAAKGGPEFFLVINVQMPGSPRYCIALYYMMKTPLEDNPILQSFADGDDAYRNSRFKLIPYVSKGSWIVKQSVGNKACLVGQALETRYIRGGNYLEVDIDVGSSTVARGMARFVLGYMSKLVVDMAFLIQFVCDPQLADKRPDFTRPNFEMKASNLMGTWVLRIIVEKGNTEKELPEMLIGTCRLNHVDTAKAFVVKP